VGKIYFNTKTLIVRDSRPEDLEPIAANMAQADRDEIWASNHALPLDALKRGFDAGPSFTVELKGEPIAMFGVTSMGKHDDQAGVAWLLGTDKIKTTQTAFLRLSRKVFKMLLSLCPVLYNFVDVRHKRSIEWLKWCGAAFSEPTEYGVEKMPFRLFLIRRESYV
jgi:hypothetical protein